WGTSSEPSKAHDQYLLYINPSSGLIEMAAYSAHEGYLPGKHSLHAYILYSNFQAVDGILIPMTHQGIFGRLKKKKKVSHTLQIETFAFDTTPIDSLYPDQSLPLYGDDKPTTK
ncbi:MAG: hypothetical protein AAGD05_06265, partial [Bacteroidota bacterium]